MKLTLDHATHCFSLKLSPPSFMLAALLLTFCLAQPRLSLAADSAQIKRSEHQNLALISASITRFLQNQSIGFPGKVTVTAGAIDPNLKLAACPDLQVFLPRGSRAWGQTSVGVRCLRPSPWTIYAQARVSVAAQYLVAAAPLAQGRIVSSEDFIFENGDLTQLPAGVFTDPAQAIGRSVRISMMAGTVLRQEMLKLPLAVLQGQSVMVETTGQGFTVSVEGKAMNNANDGQVLKVKLANGQIVTGIARNGGHVEIGY
jgi:flagella basal body P-ring formation protein FlgA